MLMDLWRRDGVGFIYERGGVNAWTKDRVAGRPMLPRRGIEIATAVSCGWLKTATQQIQQQSRAPGAGLRWLRGWEARVFTAVFGRYPQGAKPGTTMPNWSCPGIPRHRNEPGYDRSRRWFIFGLAPKTVWRWANPGRGWPGNRGEGLFQTIGLRGIATITGAGSPSRHVAAHRSRSGESRLLNTNDFPGLTQFLHDPLAVSARWGCPTLKSSQPAEAVRRCIVPVEDSSIINPEGLQYSYYEGEWEKAAEFEHVQQVPSVTRENTSIF